MARWWTISIFIWEIIIGPHLTWPMCSLALESGLSFFIHFLRGGDENFAQFFQLEFDKNEHFIGLVFFLLWPQLPIISEIKHNKNKIER